MGDINITFDADEQVTTISNSLSGPASATLTESDFAETDNGDDTYTYDATYTLGTNGVYLSSLDTAADSAGNDGGGSDDDLAYVGASTVDDFEDNDITDWTQPASNWSPSGTQAFEGSYAIYCDGAGTDSDNAVKTITADTYGGFSYAQRFVSFGPRSGQFRLGDGAVSNQLGVVITVDDGTNATAGEIVYYDGDYQQTGITLNTESWYVFSIENIDYANNQYDLRVYQDPLSATPSELGIVTGAGFASSMSDISEVALWRATAEYYCDLINSY